MWESLIWGLGKGESLGEGGVLLCSLAEYDECLGLGCRIRHSKGLVFCIWFLFLHMETIPRWWFCTRCTGLDPTPVPMWHGQANRGAVAGVHRLRGLPETRRSCSTSEIELQPALRYAKACSFSLLSLLRLLSTMVQLPPTFALVGPHARTLVGAAIWLCVLYFTITNIFSSWLGAVFWTPYLALLVWLFRREYREVKRRRTFDAHLSAEQLSVILELRQIVDDLDAHTIPKSTWSVYFTWQYWRPSELLPKPSLEEIKTALQDSEDAVGPYDINIRAALSKLLLISQAQKDMDLERVILEIHVRIIEHSKAREHESLIQFLARVGQLHFVEKDYARSAEELSRALDLNRQHQNNDPHCRSLMSHHQFMFCRKMLAMAYTMAKDSEAAEAICVELLAELEQEEGILNTAPLGTQLVRSMLINAYIRQGWKSLRIPEGDNTTGTVSRYLRDSLSLAAVHPSFHAHNLKQVGRLFIWAGRISQGNTAFRLSNTKYESGKQSGVPQRNCLCSPGVEIEEHGLRKCNACSKTIGLGDRWFFCRICADTDLCAGCYAGLGRDEEGGREDVEKFPRECLAHEFYEVSEDEKEEEFLMQEWIAETVLSLNAELGNVGEGK